jgi:predicted nucleotidyltransferase
MAQGRRLRPGSGRNFFESREEIAAVYLFGSEARGDARADSDVDLGLLNFETPRATLMDQPFALDADLSSLLARRVESVALNQAPPDLVYRVLSDGKIVCERSRSARIAFEVKARNDYFDILPTLLRYRKVGG